MAAGGINDNELRDYRAFALESRVQFYDTVLGDFHIGTAEEADTEAYIVFLVTGEANYLSDVVILIKVFDANIFSDGEVGGCEVHLSVFLREHLLEEMHFLVCDAGIFFSSFAPGSLLGWVAHQGGNVHHVFYERSVLLLHPYEDDRWDEDFLYLPAFSSSPSVYLESCCNKCFEAFPKEIITDGFLRSGLYPKKGPREDG